MIQIDRMMGIILVLIFVVVLAAFGYQMVNTAEDSASGKIQINNTQTLTQLVMYNSLIGYHCTGDKGGYFKGSETLGTTTYWNDWESYREENDFGLLEEAGADLECYGSTSKLPLSQGAWDSISPTDKDTWLNDQGGKYSRKQFVVTADEVELGPCIIHAKDPTDATYFITGPEHSAVSTYREGFSFSGPGYSFSGDEVDTINCKRIDGSSGNIEANNGPVITTIVIGGQDPDKEEVAGWADINTGATAENGLENEDLHTYTLCEGTSGYVQTNPGSNSDEVERNLDYTADQPPGDPDLEVANDPEANVVHPYVVITNWGECDD